MKFYYSKRIKYRNFFNKLIKPVKAIIYFSIPIASIYGFLKLFERLSKKLTVFLENKIVIILFVVLFSIPIVICIISLFYYLIKIVVLFTKDIFLKSKSYRGLYREWRSEANKNNEIHIPVLKVPTYNCFTQEFKNESKILKYIYFSVESIRNIPLNENWNIKIALGEYKDVFYIIYHTLINDNIKYMNVAIENKDLGDERQLKTRTRFTEDRLPHLELYIDDCNEEGYKKIKFLEGDREFQVATREEKIRVANLHNLRLEIWASNVFRGKEVLVDAKIKGICISWE